MKSQTSHYSRIALLALLAISITTTCSKDGSENKDEKPSPSTQKEQANQNPSTQSATNNDSSTERNNLFFLEDPHCPSNEATKALTQYASRQEGNTNKQTAEKHPYIRATTPYLSSRFISSVTLSSLKCQNATCTDATHQSQRLALCKKQTDYHPNSYESIALGLVSRFEHAYNYYLLKKNFPKVFLNIEQPSKTQFFNTMASLSLAASPNKIHLHLIESIPHDSEDSPNTNHSSLVPNSIKVRSSVFEESYLQNVSGSISYPSSTVVTYLPHTDAHKNPAPPSRPWESGWIVAQKFAEHLLAHHSGFYIPHTVDIYSDVHHLAAPTPHGTSQTQQHHKGRWLHPFSVRFFPTFLQAQAVNTDLDTTMQLAIKTWKAFSVAFADVWAFNAMNRSNHSLKGFPCLEANRDVSEHEFADKKPKILAAEDIEIFKTLASDDWQSTSCLKTDIRNPYTMGAAIAHGLEDLHAISSTHTPAFLNKKWILLAEHIGARIKQQTIEFTIEALTAELVRHALMNTPVHYSIAQIKNTQTRRLNTLRTSKTWRHLTTAYHCTILKTHFSGMIEDWQEKQYFSCNWETPPQTEG